MSESPVCLECGGAGVLCDGKVIYPHRADLHSKWFYRCPCGAYCGCHPDTDNAIGNPAGPATRAARSAAHAAFDPLWLRKQTRDGITRKKARGDGYKWLAGKLGIKAKDCHIGMMSAERARQVVQIIAESRS